MTVETILKRSCLKNNKCMRYEAEWLLECMLLRCKSKTTYTHLRKTGLMPLPHPETLRRLMSGMACHFGFPPLLLEAIQRNLKGKSDSERLVVVSFDEFTVATSVDFNTESFAMDGFVRLEDDYVIGRHSGDEDVDPTIKDVKKEELADHGLVFHCRAIRDKWVQPIGVFASRGAAPAEDLHRLLLASIIKLQLHGAIVLAVVSDGAQSNKGVWKLAQIGIDKVDGASITNSIENPSFDGRRIFFMQDPPHVFKCIRNQMFNNYVVQVIIYIKTQLS